MIWDAWVELASCCAEISVDSTFEANWPAGVEDSNEAAMLDVDPVNVAPDRKPCPAEVDAAEPDDEAPSSDCIS